MRSIVKALIGLYVALALITMGFQIYYRYPQCSAAARCTLTMTKGVVWSAIWPAYWTIQWNLLR